MLKVGSLEFRVSGLGFRYEAQVPHWTETLYGFDPNSSGQGQQTPNSN